MKVTDTEPSLQPVDKHRVKADLLFFFFNTTLKLRSKLSEDKRAIKIKRSKWLTQVDS